MCGPPGLPSLLLVKGFQERSKARREYEYQEESFHSPIAGRNRVLNIALNSGDACQGPEDLILAFVCRNQFHHRFAMLGNYDRATTLRYLIDHSEALRFELRGGHFLHDNAPINMTRIICPLFRCQVYVTAGIEGTISG